MNIQLLNTLYLNFISIRPHESNVRINKIIDELVDNAPDCYIHRLGDKSFVCIKNFEIVSDIFPLPQLLHEYGDELTFTAGGEFYILDKTCNKWSLCENHMVAF